MKMKEEMMKGKDVDLTSLMYKTGESAGNDLGCFIEEVKNRENKIKDIVEILNLTGYGKYVLKNMSKNSAVIRLTESPFTRFCLRKRFSCHWISGLLSGLFNNVSSGWTFKNSKCRIKNCSYCEFRGEIK